jgi:hypothetical protein
MGKSRAFFAERCNSTREASIKTEWKFSSVSLSSLCHTLCTEVLKELECVKRG